MVGEKQEAVANETVASVAKPEEPKTPLVASLAQHDAEVLRDAHERVVALLHRAALTASQRDQLLAEIKEIFDRGL